MVGTLKLTLMISELWMDTLVYQIQWMDTLVYQIRNPFTRWLVHHYVQAPEVAVKTRGSSERKLISFPTLA